MEEVIIKYFDEPKLKEPIFIEGLPGVGNVGKLAAEHLIDEIGAECFGHIYSKHFPPQVFVEEGGTIRLVNNALYYKKATRRGEHDIIILTGDYQGFTPEGQYELADVMLQIAKKFNVKQIFTLGGYSTGKVSAKPRVFGAATDKELVEEMKKYNVTFVKSEPMGGIVGASGLLLGLGQLYNFRSVCLLGETAGYFIDPKGAEAVLRVLTAILNLTVDYTKLIRKAEEIDMMAAKLREFEQAWIMEGKGKKEDLGYFG